MGNKKRLILLIFFANFLRISNGCQIDGGLNLGPVPNHETIYDTFRGIIRSEATTNIERIASINFGGALVGLQPYLDITHENSQFVVQTSNAFDQYEALETALSFSVTINFVCTGGNTSPLILMVHITDTNNNDPEFIPTNEFEFVVAPPLPPGFLVTGCLNEITVRDIDLTTRSIIFEIEDNPYFEIEYDAVASASAVAKEFKAQLKTSTFIRTLREPVTLRITATDVDETGDDPRSTSGTVRILGDTEFEFPEELVFSQTFYFANYTADHQLVQLETIFLQQGFDAYVNFTLDGEYQSYFTASSDGNQVSLVVSTPLPMDILVEKQIYLIVRADREYTSGDSATIVIHLPEETPLLFESAFYEGYIVDNALQLSSLVLSEGYEGFTVSAEVVGEYSTSFTAVVQGNLVTITMAPLTDDIIEANSLISLQVVASTTSSRATTIVSLTVMKNDNVTPAFDKSIYTGSYDPINGLTVEQITFVQGFDETVSVDLFGEHQGFFQINELGPIIRLTSSTIPPELYGEQRITLSIEATKPRTVGANAAVIINLPADSQTELDVSFDQVIYEGVIQNGLVSHETITVTGFSGTSVGLEGEYSSLFETDINNGEVTVRAVGSLTLPADITHLALELRAGAARAVLILDVSQSDIPTPAVPVVTFTSASYAVRVEIIDTGLVGQVHASADNGEAVRYSLQLNNVHLEERLSINNLGELHLSAPVNSGLYTFQVVATTIFTQETGTATVHLSAEAITVCGDEIVMPPLIVLDRDEEEAHYNLINIYEGCHFSLANRWPLNQTWLYVDETGLHTIAIDREHESIAFMTLSQVQVEITLHCETDETRVKRSLNSESLDPYDYGTSKWVLTDTILYNSRRSLVNLIVNDINDNAPVFVGKEREPIAVGYPVADLEERVLPRSLAELQATDADIGENAALLYWSSEPALAVAPATGFVHVRDGATLEHDSHLTVHATDRNGQGLNGSIDIVVKLLDESNILVVTVRDAFLDNENNILSHLSESVGYEIKVLRSIVISDDEASRKKREISSASGASLQLYVYGLIDREPVSIEQLTNDITNAVLAQVNIASTVSLEDHLAGQEICVIPERDTGLLAATIVLSVLLFIIIVLIAVWFFLRWRRKHNYDQFSDANSLASRNESVDQFPKPIEVVSKPRLNIEELKKSERRLQEMLDAPIQEVTVEPTMSRKDAILDMPSPSDPNVPIVIQSIDKLKDAMDSSDDEFGERKSPKRKSVVTFNENVEKIIHLEDTDAASESETPGYEIYKL